MLLSAVSVLVVAQSSSKVPEGLMNNPVYLNLYMFRATMCPSSGETIVFLRRLVIVILFG